MLALTLEALEAEKAKERQIRKPVDSVTANLREQNGEASEKAAKAVGASARNVQKAKMAPQMRHDVSHLTLRGMLAAIKSETKQAKEDEQAADLARPVRIELPAGIHRGDSPRARGRQATNYQHCW